MALCHDVTIDRSHGKPTYTSASPDELAFVDFAKECGMEYQDKAEQDVVILHNTVAGGEPVIEYHKLEGICEFTSDRRMSSNIYKKDNKYFVYTKGADSSVERCLGETDQKLLDHTRKLNEQFAVNGLRNLFLARGEITKEEYEEWFEKIQMAKNSLESDDIKEA